MASFTPFQADPSDSQRCDLNRIYQGTVGVSDDESAPSNVTINVSSKNGAIAGEIYGERQGASKVTVTSGQAEADGAIHFTDSLGGEYVGRCEGGMLSGTYTRAGEQQPFNLAFRPKDWPLVHVATLEQKFWDLCSAKDTNLRYIGGAASLDAAINKRLLGDMFKQNVARLGSCGDREFITTTDLRFATRDVLTIRLSTYEYFGGAHPIINWYPPASISLRTGKDLELTAVVNDAAKLREFMPQCMADFDAARGLDESGSVASPRVQTDPCELSRAITWGCTDDGPKGPAWGIAAGGLAIGMRDDPLASDSPGHGPVISWAALKRDGLLPEGSPASHLWDGVEAAPEDAPACSAAIQPSRWFKASRDSDSVRAPRSISWTVAE